MAPPGSGGAYACLLNGALVATFLTLNCTLNLLNRWALGIYGFKYPIVMTTCHMAFSVVVLAPYMLFTAERRQSHVDVLRKGWKGVACIGCFMAVNISFNNLSLVYITLSLNQIIRASLPVVTAILAVVVEGKDLRTDEFLALLLLTAGTMLTIYEGSMHGEAHGIAICLVGLASNALMMTFSGRILSEKLDCFRLTFYTSPVSMVVLLPFLYTNELAGFMDYWSTHQGGVIGVLLAGSMNAVLYNVVHYLMIQRISSTGTCVIGQVKVLGLLVISSFLLNESSEWTHVMLAGASIAMAGFMWYSQINLSRSLSKAVDASKSPNPKRGADKSGAISSIIEVFTSMNTRTVMLLTLVILSVVGTWFYTSGLELACMLSYKC